MAEAPSVNLFQAIAILLIGYFAVRGVLSFFRSPSSNSPSSTSAASGGHRPAHNGSRVNPAHVEQVAQMFPQLNRRNIMWDLQRNGGSVQATTERVLSGRSLEVPPPSFQPILPQPSTSTPTRPASSQPRKPSHPDLITRYNLSSKVSSSAETSSSAATPSEGTGAQKRPAWSANKAERQALLQKRREEMILAARRKMEEKDKAGKAS
ncbi:hypothetical protein NA57DRAFT_49576 [Rhizodiscina lignyota]|uniref:Coupling of ubiquitin conjugation to ER degradation protein 1 n=1 Tax=Rhizodiscina lignyota TaxID=1504668 RepID=A0A9P4I0Q2_9PEZI|nr:hypothetical protein NA57DRAFT_49576 [Rhizodiscina lignyota]